MAKGRKPSVKTEVEEALLEASCFYASFADELAAVLGTIDENETMDHQNDKLRVEAMGFMLDALQALAAQNYADVDTNLHGAIKRMHEQEALDFQDDKPRVDAKLLLSLARQKAIHNKEDVIKQIGALAANPGVYAHA